MLMITKNIQGCGSIYCITNLINNKKYIGQTSELYLSKRWCQHKINARNGVSNYLYNAIRKYGEDNFQFKVLIHKIPIDKLSFYETLWIEKLNTKAPNGYNLTNGGEGTRGHIPWNKGIPRSQETVEKIKSHITDEVKEQMRQRVLGDKNPMYGRKGQDNPTYGNSRFGEDNPFYNKHHSEETKTFLSNIQSEKKKKVAMLDVNTEEIICIFASYSEAAKYLRVNTEFTKADDSAISKCARGICKCIYNHKWKNI